MLRTQAVVAVHAARAFHRHLTIVPPPCCCMRRMAAWQRQNVALGLALTVDGLEVGEEQGSLSHGAPEDGETADALDTGFVCV